MKEREELKPYENELKRYITTFNFGISEKHKMQNALSGIATILEKNGRKWPEKSDVEEYRKQTSGNERTVQQQVRRIEKFFEWLRKENIPMEEDATMAMFPEEAQAKESTQQEAVKPKGKAGRKRLDTENGEIRSEKFTVYVTPTQAEALKALCLIDGVSSVAERINELIEAELKSNSDMINDFFALKERRKGA